MGFTVLVPYPGFFHEGIREGYKLLVKNIGDPLDFLNFFGPLGVHVPPVLSLFRFGTAPYEVDVNYDSPKKLLSITLFLFFRNVFEGVQKFYFQQIRSYFP